MHFSYYEWNQMHISNEEYMEGDQNILRIQKIAKEYQREASKKDPKSVKKIRGNSPRYMHKVGFTFQCSVHNMESSPPSRNFEHKHVQESIDKRKEAINLATWKNWATKARSKKWGLAQPEEMSVI